MDSHTLFNLALAAIITAALIALPLAAFLTYRLWRALPQHRPSKNTKRDAGPSEHQDRIRDTASSSPSSSTTSSASPSASELTDRLKGSPSSLRTQGTLLTSGSSEKQCTVTIYLGSGGHSAEMLQLVSGLDTCRYRIRHYVVGEDDNASVEKVHRLESSRGQVDVTEAFKSIIKSKKESETPGGYTVHRIPRSRYVHQSFLTTPFTLAKSLTVAMTLVRQLACPSKSFLNKKASHKSVLIMNGPGTCVSLALAVIGLRILGVVEDEKTPDLIFVESFARVKTLSLTGKLLYPLCDVFLVQWPGLQTRYPRAQYVGALV